jgi:hypothetical protein
MQIVIIKGENQRLQGLTLINRAKVRNCAGWMLNTKPKGKL